METAASSSSPTVLTNVISFAELAAAIWPTVTAAKVVLDAFAASQGWVLAGRGSAKFGFRSLNADGSTTWNEAIEHKLWMCSKGYDRGQPNERKHVCLGVGDAGETCEKLNATGRLLPVDITSTLPAKYKTGCPVTITIRVVKKSVPAGYQWPVGESPVRGYRVVTSLKELTPCAHNHCGTHSNMTNLTQSVRTLDEDIRALVADHLTNSFPAYLVRRYVEKKFGLAKFTDSAWNSLVGSVRSECGLQDSTKDMEALLERLMLEHRTRGATFDFQFTDKNIFKIIFFMTGEMIQSFRRCGQFAVMDSTCKTNRFGMNLFFVCGYNEHMQLSVYASALMLDDTHSSYEFVFSKMRAAVGAEAWMRMTCVATDGCTAMTGALRNAAPHCAQQRCIWHLQQNIQKHAGSKQLRVVHEWYKCVYAKTETKFTELWNTLVNAEEVSDVMKAYLEANIFPLRDKWSAAWTAHNTNFGSHSTQLVESLNRVMKMWQMNDKAPLTDVVDRICTVNADEKTTKVQSNMRDAAYRIALQSVVAAGNSHNREDFEVKVRQSLTGSAAAHCEEQLRQAVMNYIATRSDAPDRTPFSAATDTFVVRRRRPEADSRAYRVHISDNLIYCPCGDCIVHLLPCRHVYAANIAAGENAFRPGQYHSRWWLNYTPENMSLSLSAQSWLRLGEEITAEGITQVKQPDSDEEEFSLPDWGPDTSLDVEDTPNPDVPTAATLPPLPQPLYDLSIQGEQLVSTKMAPQHLYQLFTAKAKRIPAITASKPGRPSNKRTVSSMEGKATKAIQAVVPASMLANSEGVGAAPAATAPPPSKRNNNSRRQIVKSSVTNDPGASSSGPAPMDISENISQSTSNVSASHATVPLSVNSNTAAAALTLGESGSDSVTPGPSSSTIHVSRSGRPVRAPAARD